MARKTSQGIPVDRLDQMIKDLGVRVKLYKSTICPNMKSIESFDHDLNCKICKNNMIDFAPKQTLALFQQQDLIEQFKLQGTFHIDEILVSFLSGETLFPYARLELLDFKEDFSELVERQTGSNIDVLKYAACEVLGVFAATNSTTRKEYHTGTDFVLDVNGNIDWTGSANKPADKKIYTIYYRFHPVFRAIKAVHRDRYSQYNNRISKIKAPKTTVGDATFVKLPETWVLKRDYLLEREDQEGNRISPNTYHDPNA